MADMNILDVIYIVASRLKQSEDSTEVFKSVLNLSIASKECKSFLNDILLIEISYRFTRDRSTWLINNRLKVSILNNEFNKFKYVADLVVEQFSTPEGIKILDDLLPYVVLHSKSPFLSLYLDYLNKYPLDEKRKSSTVLSLTRPNILLNAITTSTNHQWDDKTLLLFGQLLKYWNFKEDQFPEVIEAINTHTKLDFAQVSLHLNWHHRNGRTLSYSTEYQQTIIRSLLPKKEIENERIVRVTSDLIQLPIEKQPWFFGNLSSDEIQRKLDVSIPGLPPKALFLVTFTGASLYCHHLYRSYEVSKDSQKLPHYGLSNRGVVNDLALYQFYCLLANHNLDGMKELQARCNFNWAEISRQVHPDPSKSSILGHQPHPLAEYLEWRNLRQEVVDWLFELCPLKRIHFEKLSYYGKSELHFSTLKKIIHCGGSLSTAVWRDYIIATMPTKEKELKVLVNAWDNIQRRNAWKFYLDEYIHMTKTKKRISETKMTVLLAWKHAEGMSIGFRGLPKELIQIIIKFVNDPPLELVFAKILADRCQVTKDPSDYKWHEWLEDHFAATNRSRYLVHHQRWTSEHSVSICLNDYDSERDQVATPNAGRLNKRFYWK